MDRKIEYKNFPFEDVLSKADELIKAGSDVYQKFTCGGCGQRLTMEKPNKFFAEGTCDKCPYVTNIQKDGCNFMIHMKLK